MLFISHRTSDKAAAEDLKSRALARGYSTEQLFLDSDPDAGIAAGSDWEHVIYDRLKQCQALIVVCSPRWAESKWCFAELVFAKSLGKQVFPVVIEECAIDAILGERQSVFVFKGGEAAFDRLWKSLDQNGLGPHEHRPWPPDDGDPCPFPGLLAFSERFAPVYFGRDPETAIVLEELNKMRDRGEPRLLMIVGGSGSGKSSLLRAGVLPRFDRNRDWLVLPTLRYGQSPNDDLTLLARLAQELAARFPPDASSRSDWKELRSKFESNNVEQAARDFFEVTQDLNLARGCRDATTLLPIDQFEEFLTAAAKPSAERFLRFLHALLAKNNGRLLVIGTLRSDYLDVYERHPHALQPPYLHTYRLPPFPWERVTDVIVQPAARVSVTFTNELLERLKLDAPTSDALPLLAFTLEKLFRQCADDKLIELAEYESLGGMTGAVAQAVSRILPPKLPPDTEQALRLSFVRHLVQVNEKDEFVRRPARWSHLPRAARPLLDKFVSERLLHTSGDGEAATVEVSHEALFRCWDQLAKWLQESSRILRWRRDVERDRKASSDKSWSGLTRAQLAVSRRWPIEIPDELSQDESNWIKQGIRRERTLRGTVAAVVLLIASLGVVAWYLRSIAIEQTSIANTETDKAKKSDTEAKNELARAQFALGRIPFEKQDYDAAVLWWVRAQSASRDTPFRNSMSRLISSWTPQELRLTHDAKITAIAFSPTGSTVLTCSEDGIARLWDARSGAPRGESLKHAGSISAVAFCPDGQTVLTSSQGSSTAQLWDASTGAAYGEPLKNIASVRTVAFSPDGLTAATGALTEARLWDVRTGMPRGEPLKHIDGVNIAAFSPDGQTVVTCGTHRAILWDVRTGTRRGAPLEHEHPISALAFSPDSHNVLTGDGASLKDLADIIEGKVTTVSWAARLWDTQTGAPRREPLQHPRPVYSVAFSPNGKTVLTGSDDAARLWDAKTGTAQGEPLKHKGTVNSVAFSPDGRRVLTGSSDATARLWDALTGAPQGEPLKHERKVSVVGFSPDGLTVLTGSEDATVRLWDVRTRAERSRQMELKKWINCLAVSPDGQTVLTGSGFGIDPGEAQLWDIRTGVPRSESLKHERLVSAVAFSPDAQLVLIGSEDKSARLWDAHTGVPRSEPLRHGAFVNAVAFSPDGHTMVTGSGDFQQKLGEARLWDTRTGAPQGEPLKHEGIVNAVAFSPDGLTLLTGSGDMQWRIAQSSLSGRSGTRREFGEARMWDVRTGMLRGVPMKHKESVNAVVFSPSGRTVLTGSDDYKAQFWDARTGAPVGSPLKHNGSVSAVAFSPDGQTVLTGNKVFELSGSSLATLSKAVLNPTGEARLWDVLTGMPLGEPMKCGQSVNTVAFSPDGQTLLTGSGGLVQVWPIPAPAIDDRVESKRSQLSVEVRTWKRLDANGEVIRLTFNEWNERRKELKTLDGPCDRPSWDEYKAWKTNREK